MQKCLYNDKHPECFLEISFPSIHCRDQSVHLPSSSEQYYGNIFFFLRCSKEILKQANSAFTKQISRAELLILAPPFILREAGKSFTSFQTSTLGWDKQYPRLCYKGNPARLVLINCTSSVLFQNTDSINHKYDYRLLL